MYIDKNNMKTQILKDYILVKKQTCTEKISEDKQANRKLIEKT